MALSDFEKSLLTMIAQGMLSKEIATKTGRSKATIDVSVRLLCAKFDARSRAHLVAIVMGSGLLDSDAP